MLLYMSSNKLVRSSCGLSVFVLGATPRQAARTVFATTCIAELSAPSLSQK